MTARLRRALGAALLLALGSALLAPAAQAEVRVNHDKHGDVVSLSIDENTDGDELETTPAPTVANGDIVRTRMAHNTSWIRVAMKFADLRRDKTAGYVVQVATDEHLHRDVVLLTQPGHWQGHAEMEGRNGGTSRCRVHHSIDYDANIVRLSFPRVCVSRPDWVRLSVGAVRFGSSDADAGDFQAFLDDALIDGDADIDRLQKSVRLHRG